MNGLVTYSHGRSIMDMLFVFGQVTKLVYNSCAVEVERIVEVLVPLQAVTRGRPYLAKSKPASSIKREPSSFELSAPEIKRRKYKCTKCGAEGHNSRRCSIGKTGDDSGATKTSADTGVTDVEDGKIIE